MTLRAGDNLIDLSTPIVMGILNATPDSFYNSSRLNTEDEAIARTEKMLNDGATIIDIGGYSTRPGAQEISSEEEIERVIPLIKAIHNVFPEAILSIDSFRPSVVSKALETGATIVNDISGFQDEEILDVTAKYNAAYILMHMKGTPQTMMGETNYNNLFGDIAQYFTEKINTIRSKGINDIILDPGFGFAKTIEQNHHLLANSNGFNIFDLPVLIGISRKSMIYKKLGITPEEALNGTIALNALALQNGAKILRVHDVKEASELIKLLS